MIFDAKVTKIKKEPNKTTVIIEVEGDFKPEKDGSCFIEVDSKKKTCRTNRFAHALWSDISKHTGNTLEEIKASVKDTCEVGYNEEYGTYSWAAASRTEANHAIKHTLDIVREENIPLSVKSIEQMDAETHLNFCLYRNICMVCGYPTEDGSPLCARHRRELNKSPSFLNSQKLEAIRDLIKKAH